MLPKLATLVLGLSLAGHGLGRRINDELSEEDAGLNDFGKSLSGVYSHCGKTRQCYGVPDGCVEKKSCQQMIAYGESHEHRIPVEIYGAPPNASYQRNFWVGFGASSSGGMDNSSVVQCAHFADGKSEVVAAYNAANHTYVPLENKHEGIHHEGAVFHDGFVRCAFQLDVVRNVSGTPFDLRNPYFLLLGSGWVNHTSKHVYELKWHIQKPMISSQKIVFACGPKCHNATTPRPVVPVTTAVMTVSTVVTTSTPIPTRQPEHHLHDVYIHCGLSRHCYGVPVGCILDKSCTQILSYGKEDSGKLPVDLYGTAPNSTYADNFWVGFGASVSGGMDNTAVVQCAQYSNGSVDVVTAGVAPNHTYQPLQDRHTGISDIATRTSNGFVQCSFSLDVQRNVAGNPFDLTKPYFILVGSGWINQTGENAYELMWHLEKPAATAIKVIMSCGNNCPPSDGEDDLVEPFVDDVYTQCGKERRCFGVPDGCVATKNCTQLLSYGPERQRHIPVEMYGTAPNSTYQDDFWIGFGTSMSGGMDLTAVVQCAHYANGSNDVLGAYNAPNHTYQSIPDRHVGITHRRAKFEKGFLRCGFRLAVERTVSGNLFNLTTPYNILVASGWINVTGDNTYELKWHLQKPYISPAKVVMSCGNKCPKPEFSSEFADPYEKCGVVRKCYGVPEGCVAKQNCLQLLAYEAQYMEQMDMLLYGTAPNSTYANDFWIGFGASTSGGMDWSAVIQCGYFSNGTTDVVAAQTMSNHTYQTLNDRYDGISHIRTSFSNGFVQCAFKLDVERNVTGNIFDLNNPYTLLLASGWINQTAPNKYDFKWHLEKPYISPKPIVFACGNYCPNTTTAETVPTETTTTPTTPTTTSTGKPTDPTTTMTTSAPPTQSPYMCGGDVQCYGVPEGCIETQNCQKLVMFRQEMGEGTTGKLRVALIGTAPNKTYSDNFWVGFAASASGGMDDASVVQCARYGNGTVDVVAAYNAPGHNYQPLQEKHEGISDITPMYDNGFVSCSFHLDVVRNVSSHVFDLSTPYTLLLASGWINETGSNTYELKWHLEKPWNSPEKIIIACGENCTTTTTAASTTTMSPDNVYNQCGITRMCLGTPDQQCVEKKNCEQLISYGSSENSDEIPVDLYGRNSKSPADFWIGFGMSMSGKMASSAVIMCTTNNSGHPQIITGYNVNGTNAHVFNVISQSGIHHPSAWMADGFARCSFGLSLKRMVSEVLYDLHTPHTLLLGTGPMKDGAPGYHQPTPMIFPKAVMGCGNSCPPAPCTNATCFGVPAGCEQTGGCTALVAWSAVPNQKQSQSAGVVQVGIYGTAPQGVPSNQFWIGLGVSHGRTMDHTAVVQCVVRPDGKNDVVAAYNPEGHHSNLLNDTSYGIHNGSIVMTDGELNCAFQMDVVREMPGNMTFDLRDLMFVMLGSGPLKNETYIPTFHTKIPRVSHTEYAMSCDTNCSFTPTTTTSQPPMTTTMKPSTSGRFGFPAGCEKEDKNCQILAKYKTSETDNQRVSITLEGKPDASGDKFWVALGVAPGPAMDDAMVVECVHWSDGKTEKTDVFASWNNADNTNVRTKMNGIYVNSTVMENGRIKCSLDMDVVRTLENHGRFNLSNPYNLLLALGLTKPDTDTKVEHKYKIFSAGKVVVNSTDGGDVPVGHESHALKKVHACLMVFAWNFCAAMGIFFARHTKNMLPEKMPFGIKMWFHFHRGHMITAVLAAIAAAVVIFVDRAQWSNVAHAYTGIISLALAFIQPIIATFRPHPGTPKRKYFNYVHWSIGYSTLILAGVTMFLGTRLTALGVPHYIGYIIIGSYVFNLVLQLLLEVHKARQAKLKLLGAPSSERLMTDDGVIIEKPGVDPLEPLEPEDGVRKTILALTWVGLFASTVAVIVLIATA